MAVLTGILLDAARRWPGRPAAVWGPDGSTFLWSDLADLAPRIGGWLRAQGVGPGRNLLLEGSPCVEGNLLVWGAWWVGAMVVAAPPGAPPAWLDRAADLAGVALRLDGRSGRSSGGLPALGSIALLDAIAAGPAVDPVEVPDDADAAVVFTSGSTGPTRGVVLSQAALAASARRFAALLDLTSADRLATRAGLHTITGLRTATLFPAVVGAASVSLPGESPLAGLFSELCDHQATALISGPALINTALQAPDRFRALRDQTALRLVVGGGGASPPELRRRFADAMNLDTWWAYGLSETSGGCFFHRQRPGDGCASLALPAAGSVARARGPDGALVPDGVDGDLEVSGEAVFTRYLGGGGPRVEGGRRWVETGDVGMVQPDGAVVLRGRRARMYTDGGGEKVLLDEVERRLLESGLVLEVAVLALEGPGGRAVLAALVGGDAPDAEALFRQLRGHLLLSLPPRCLPGRWHQVPALPRGPNGKVDPDGVRLLLEEAPTC